MHMMHIYHVLSNYRGTIIFFAFMLYVFRVPLFICANYGWFLFLKVSFLVFKIICTITLLLVVS